MGPGSGGSEFSVPGAGSEFSGDASTVKPEHGYHPLYDGPVVHIDISAPVPRGGGPRRRIVDLLPLVEMQGERPAESKPAKWPLFYFGVRTIRQFQLRNKIYCRIFPNLVEVVVLRGVTTEDILVLAFLLCHSESNLFVASNKDRKLTHIGRVTREQREVKNVSRTIQSAIREFPCHLVVEVKYSTINSLVGSPMMNKTTINRLYTVVNDGGADLSFKESTE